MANSEVENVSSETVKVRSAYAIHSVILHHIPEKAEYVSRWKVHSHDERELFRPWTSDALEKRAEIYVSRFNWEEIVVSTLCEGDWIDSLSLEKFIFYLVYPSHPSIVFNGQLVSFGQLPMSCVRPRGLKLAYFHALTICRDMSFSVSAAVPVVDVVKLICEPGETLHFFRGEGKHLITVQATSTFIVHEKTTQLLNYADEVTVPPQVYEQVRAHLFSTTKTVNFTNAEEYGSNMAAYYARTHRKHAQMVRDIVSAIPPSVRCVFPMDGTGVGARIRPGSISGDSVKHWLTHEDTVQEEALATMKRAGPDDVIIVMYGAVFFF